MKKKEKCMYVKYLIAFVWCFNHPFKKKDKKELKRLKCHKTLCLSVNICIKPEGQIIGPSPILDVHWFGKFSPKINRQS